MIEYFDDVLEIHIAQLIDESVHNGTHPWHWNYKANSKIPSRHWHTLAGHSIDEMMKNGYDYLMPLWETIEHKYPNLKIKR